LTPVAVSGGLAFTALSSGFGQTCGLTSDGTAYCWGGNRYGGLGDGSTTNRATPVPVVGGITFASLIAGWGNHSCGVTSGGGAYCWVEVRGQVVSAPRCRATRAGEAYCWGHNMAGGLGDGTTTNRTTPVPVVGGITFASLAAGGEHTCGLTSSGAAYCWGYNQNGALGDGTTSNRTSPAGVVGGLTFASLAAGGEHTCGLTSSGAAYCWGGGYDNTRGQLGDGTTTKRTSPVTVSGALVFQAISAGWQHTCGLTRGGVAYCWGNNYDGQLGDGTRGPPSGGEWIRTSPVPVSGGLVFQIIGAGSDHTCGLTSNGVAYCWGDNEHGELGDGTTTKRTSPVAVAGGLSFASLTVGGSQTCGLTFGGAAYCWGWNQDGQLGDGSTTDRSAPVAVANP
jgi:alpha-tubulin suppressor-like RCC1 family protein